MSTNSPIQRLLLVSPVLAAVMVGAVFLHGRRAPAASEGADVHVAASICDAHRFKLLAAKDPDFAFEIPPEFDKPFPTADACRSYKRASDPNAPGPLQPIPFSHAHHAGTYEIHCQYCHSGTDRSQAAGVPAVEVCMGCHSQFGPTYDEFDGIASLKQHWENKQPIVWEQIHRTPEHVQFRHNRHVKAGIACQQCHGPVEELDKLYMTADTKWWPWGLPTKKLEMGWCIQCHRQNDVSQDCNTCHY